MSLANDIRSKTKTHRAVEMVADKTINDEKRNVADITRTAIMHASTTGNAETQNLGKKKKKLHMETSPSQRNRSNNEEGTYERTNERDGEKPWRWVVRHFHNLLCIRY